jgi:multicomponent Na+:H+ antiporter subunit D
MARAWGDAFWRPPDGIRDMTTPSTALLVTIAALSVVTVAMTFAAEPLFELASRSSHQLLQRDEYVRAVLGGAP